MITITKGGKTLNEYYASGDRVRLRGDVEPDLGKATEWVRGSVGTCWGVDGQGRILVSFPGLSCLLHVPSNATERVR